jgi:hypothetical protein
MIILSSKPFEHGLYASLNVDVGREVMVSQFGNIAECRKSFRVMLSESTNGVGKESMLSHRH